MEHASNRIVDRLTACSVPCAVLVAPAGFGKTFAAKAYASQFPRSAIVTATSDMTTASVMAILEGQIGREVHEADASGAWLNLASECIWGAAEDTCIVLDSAECLDDATLFEVLAALERFRPETGAVVVCLRRDPTLFTFVDVFQPHLLIVFRRADLELSFEEVRSSVPTGVTVSTASLYHIYHLTRGWPVPALSLLRAGIAANFDTTAWHLDHPALSDLFDWLDANVIKLLSDEARAVLLQCVASSDMLPDDFDVPHENEPTRADRQLYRGSQCADIGFTGEISVHPLVALTIRARYATELKQCAHALAATFLEHDEPLRAVRAMVSISDLGRAADVLASVDFESARDLGGFPYPGLVLEHYSRTKPDYERYPLLWLNLVPCRYYAVGPRILALEGAELLKRHGVDLPESLGRWVTAVVAALCSEAGDLQAAEQYVADLRADAGSDADGSLDLAEMYLDVVEGRYASALARWQRLRVIFRPSPVWYALHLRCAARAEVRLGNLDAGEDALRGLSSSLQIGGCPSLATFGDMEAAFVAWHKGDATAFRLHRRDFAHIAAYYDVPAMWPCLGALFGDDLGANQSWGLYDSMSTLILATDCRDDRAPALAQRALSLADAESDVAMRIWARIVGASSQPSRARELIAEAALLARSTDSAALQEFVEANSTNSPEGSSVTGFLQGLPDRLSVIERMPDTASAEPLILHVATGDIRRGAQTIKVSEGTLQLLMFLVVHGRAKRDAIIDRLWPELDGDAASNALKICVHRARAQLGVASSIIVQNAMYSLGEGVQSSYPHIQELVAKAAQPIADDSLADFRTVFDRLARGLVAEWAPWEWFLPFRRSLLHAMHVLGERLGEYELAHGSPQLALQVARRMIGADSLDESSRALAIRAYRKTGHSAAAIAEFREFSEVLKRDSGTVPSESLRSLVNSV